MSGTYLMSYPGPSWHVRGGANFRSEPHSPTNPRRAMGEWLSLCDAILRAGGHVLVMPPVDGPEGVRLTGMVYTANAGQLFHTGDAWVYVVSNMAVAHRREEGAHVRAFMERAGVAVSASQAVWEGQADLQFLGGHRYLATWGVRSDEASRAEVRALLGPSARVLDLKIHPPFFHGDTCLDPLESRAGDTVLLAYAGALDEGGLPLVRQFAGDRIDVLSIEREDALAYACNSLCVNGTVLLPQGISTWLRGQLARRGFSCEEMDFSELFGKGGGGPRCLVNELRGLVVNPGAPDYASLRDSLYAKMESYPESAASAEAPPSAQR